MSRVTPEAAAAINAGKTYVLSGATLRKLIAAGQVRGTKGQITVSEKADGSLAAAFESEVRVLGSVNGAILPVYIPLRPTGEPPIEP